MADGPRYLGRVANEPTKELDLVKWEGRPITVRLDTMDFTSLCPVTGQPDFAMVSVEYVPQVSIVETKSFKLFLQTFRDTRAYNEELADEIAGEFFKQVLPAWVTVVVTFSPRGGTSVKAISRCP